MSMANNLLEIWGVYSNKILTEKAHTSKNAKFGTKPGPGPVKLNDKKAGEIERKNETGPAAADNFNGPAFNRNISDLRTMTDADKKEKPYVAKLNVSEEKFDRSLEKSTKTIINNNMKSTFNKLFEEVMNNEDDKDLAALGVDTEAHEGGEGGDEITITLSRELAQKLHDALMAQLGSDEEQHGGEEKDEASDEDEMNINPMAADEDEEDADEEDNEEDADEEDSEEEDEKKMKTEASGAVYSVDNPVDGDGKLVPDSAGASLMKHGNIKVGDKTAKLANKGKAQFNVNNTVDGDGKEVPDSAGASLMKHGNIKPKSKIKGGNQEFFGVS